jgi:hypothetical protein
MDKGTKERIGSRKRQLAVGIMHSKNIRTIKACADVVDELGWEIVQRRHDGGRHCTCARTRLITLPEVQAHEGLFQGMGRFDTRI